jgi:hypothetical protein
MPLILVRQRSFCEVIRGTVTFAETDFPMHDDTGINTGAPAQTIEVLGGTWQ